MHRLLAVLGPLAVALVGGWGLLWPDRAGPLAEGPARIEAMLAEHQPRLVIVGNSLVHRGIDTSTLGHSLGLPEGAAQQIYVPNSRMPVWYAAIKERIVENGHTPEVIVVGASPVWTVDNTLPDERIRARLSEHLRGHDPVIARALGEPESALLSRARTRRVQLRESLLSGIRRGTLSALGRDDDTLRPLLDELFAARNTDRLPDRVIPIAQAAAPSAPPTAASTEGALIRDLVALCEPAGIKVVFAWIPVRAGGDLTDEEARDAIHQMADVGAGFIDLSSEDIPTSYFEDRLHLNMRGKEWLTAALADGLRRIDALGSMETATLPRWLRPAPVLRLAGTLPDDARIRRWGEGAAWVPPGGTLQIHTAEPGEARIGLTLSAHGKATGAPRITVAEQSLLLTGRSVIRSAELTGAPAVITVAVPEDGPLTLVHRVSLDGEVILSQDVPADLLTLAPGETTGADLTPRPVTTDLRDGLHVAPLGDLAAVENDALFRATGERLCSPIRVLVDGAALAAESTACRTVRGGTEPAFCARGKTAVFRAPDDPGAVALALDAARSCGEWRWLYPGDALLLSDLQALSGGGSTLRLQGAALSEGPWRVTVRVRNRTLLRTTLTPADLASGSITLLLKEPIPPRPRNLTITIEADGYLGLSALMLGDEEPDASPRKAVSLMRAAR